MTIFDSIVKISINKLFLQGKIDEVYDRMYTLAHNLAVDELKKNFELIDVKLKELKLTGQDYFDKYLEEMLEYKNERIQHHINEMKELLNIRTDLKNN